MTNTATSAPEAHVAPEQLTQTDPTHEQDQQELMDTAELIELIEQRAQTYGLLSRLYFAEVDQAFLNELHTMRFPANSGSETVDKGFKLMANYLSNLWENSLDELAVDYSRTFIGQGIDAFSAAYPFESVYTSEKRLLMQEARDEVLAIYRSMGLDKLDTWKEGEDHLAVELEFMKLLCNRTVDALIKQDEDKAFSLLSTQLNFLNDHLISWVPMMTGDVQKFAQTGLYQGLAFVTEGYLETDKEFLAAVVSDD